MNSQNFVFGWNTYSESLKGIVQNLSKFDSFTDVTLVSDDKKQKKAHKFILSAVSDTICEIRVVNTIHLKNRGESAW